MVNLIMDNAKATESSFIKTDPDIWGIGAMIEEKDLESYGTMIEKNITKGIGVVIKSKAKELSLKAI